jgi:hypothetical protein
MARLTPIQVQKRQIPLEQIIAVKGQNPLATGIETAGNVIGAAITKRAQLQQQGQQLAALAKMAGQPVPDTNTLTPELYEKGLSFKSAADQKRAEAAKQRVDLELKLEQLRAGYSEIDPATGAKREYPGVQGLSIAYGPDGNPVIRRDETYKPKEIPKSTGGGQAQRGSAQQSQYVDAFDSTPLYWNRDKRAYLRVNTDEQPKGKITLNKGQAEAVQNASRGAVLLPKVEELKSDLENRSEIGARLATTPVIGPIFYPQETQLLNELAQVGFQFGGKNFTGHEEKIIRGAMIPGPTDSKASREKKFQAIQGYVTGQMNLSDAANLLGPAGDQIKKVLASSQAGSQGLQAIPTTPPPPMAATNPKTGQKIISTDGGQTWQPAR